MSNKAAEVLVYLRVQMSEAWLRALKKQAVGTGWTSVHFGETEAQTRSVVSSALLQHSVSQLFIYTHEHGRLQQDEGIPMFYHETQYSRPSAVRRVLAS